MKIIIALAGIYVEFSREELEEVAVISLENGDTRIQLTSIYARTSYAVQELYGATASDLDDELSGMQYTITLDPECNLKRIKTRFTDQISGDESSWTYAADLAVYSMNRIRETGFPDNLNLYVR